MAIVCPVDIVCVDGEVDVSLIIDTINAFTVACNEAKACYDKYSVGDVIRVYKVDNVMYMTNDGSDPTP